MFWARVNGELQDGSQGVLTGRCRDGMWGGALTRPYLSFIVSIHAHLCIALATSQLISRLLPL